MAQQPAPQTSTDKCYRATITMDRGTIVMDLDPQLAPNTVNNFVGLARQGFYDGVTWHRVVPDFVIQGGDPTATGAGGPGYTTVDVPPKSARYTRGVVAMAKTQTQPRGTAGSQFFVVTARDAGLPPDYAILGDITKGLGVVGHIGRLGNPVTERPTMRVVVRKMTVS